MRCSLYWGVYLQWTKSFDSIEDAKVEAVKYAADKSAAISEFSLIHLAEIDLTK